MFLLGSGSKLSANGKKPLLMEDSRRSTYYEAQPSSSIYELPASSSYNGTRKLLIPVEYPLEVVLYK
jgi:bromodomain-containing protein 9